MTLRRTFVHRFAILYLSLPTVCFLLFWVRPVVGVIGASFLVFAVVRLFRREKGDCMELDWMMPSCETIRLSPFMCMTFMTALFVWCIMAGQGGFVPQSVDWHWRNALFRDLVTHRWPVIYPEWGRALSFYLGHWLPPAVLTKLIVALGMDASSSWSWSNVFLLVWTYTGVLIVFLQMLLLLNALNAWKMFSALALLMLGDGLDALGIAVKNVTDLIVTGSCGTFWPTSFYWMDNMLYAHHGALLYCVFHQTVIPWIAVLCLADGFPLGGAGLLLPLVLLNGPLPAIGIAVMLAGLVMRKVSSSRMNLRLLVRSFCSVENFVGVFVVFPVVATYLTANPQSSSFRFTWTDVSHGDFIIRYAVFVVCEAGAYIVATWHHFHRSTWWWTTLIILLACPLVALGEGPDFSMRVSTPALLILLLMTLHSVFEYWKERRLASIAIGLLLVLGTCVPLENIRSVVLNPQDGHFGERDGIVTFDRDTTAVEGCPYDVTKNCCCAYPNDGIFYKWLARRRCLPEQLVKEVR